MVASHRQLSTLAVLVDESRRAMFEFIRRQARPVTRDQAAAHVGISRKLAAFHLEKLVDAGLLEATQQPAEPGVRRGRGRVPKVYRPTAQRVSVSVPERRLDLLGEVLVDAVADEAESGNARAAALGRARERGVELGAAGREARRLRRTGPERAIHLATGVLESVGYEPYRTDDGALRLRNCPFHPLAERQRDLVCGMNRELVDGVLRGLGNDSVSALLAPRPGECCVEVRP